MLNGARIGFFQGDVKLLLDDIKELQPTLFPSVPRLLNRIYDKVLLDVNWHPPSSIQTLNRKKNQQHVDNLKAFCMRGICLGKCCFIDQIYSNKENNKSQITRKLAYYWHVIMGYYWLNQHTCTCVTVDSYSSQTMTCWFATDIRQ